MGSVIVEGWDAAVLNRVVREDSTGKIAFQ